MRVEDHCFFPALAQAMSTLAFSTGPAARSGDAFERASFAAAAPGSSLGKGLRPVRP